MGSQRMRGLGEERGRSQRSLEEVEFWQFLTGFYNFADFHKKGNSVQISRAASTGNFNQQDFESFLA
jgi:hypothetical protein